MAKRKARQVSPEAAPSSPSESSEGPTGSESSSGSDVTESEDDSPSSSSGVSDEEGIVNVDFEFFDPKPTDFHGVKALLKSYLEDTLWDISGFVDIFLAQTTVGTVVKTSNDDNPIGILTALNLARYKDRACMKEIYQYLWKNSNGKAERENLETMWNKQAKDVGLIVSERLVNIPIDLVPPLYNSLLDEVMWATEDEPTKELQNFFKFKDYVIVTRVFVEHSKKKGSDDGKQAKVGIIQKQKGVTEDKGELIYVKPEDEIFHQLCTWSFTFPVNAESLAAHETKNVKQLRLVMGFQAKRMAAFRDAVKNLAEDGDETNATDS
ncbi:protein BCP1 [Marchantia polymorpha subsp. ruderalis]|nr:hypothetical protein MARPO_0006s0099 [Marchantia polymorpha]BBN04628.1 hypothetical protein Mp_3g06290 [Marchantia polymorpha subsp. ruderalis]|eukprot:PTQ48064.1 hypothetical protein MARPO_0006s0099 [Marchantia polymorpha]